MFSGIHSLFFGKKHHHDKDVRSADDSAADRPSSAISDNDLPRRRHSDESDVNMLYPKIDTTFSPSGNLPYEISPSLPNLKPQIDGLQKAENDAPPVDLLHGVPFQLASHLVLTNEKDDSLTKILERLKDQLSEEEIADGYNYNFDLENKILCQFGY